MPHVRHHALVVTSFSQDRMIRARHKANSVGLFVSPLMTSQINGYHTFMVPPSGSKAGWPKEKIHNDVIAALKSWMKNQNSLDEGEFLQWGEIYYGDNEG